MACISADVKRTSFYSDFVEKNQRNYVRLICLLCFWMSDQEELAHASRPSLSYCGTEKALRAIANKVKERWEYFWQTNTQGFCV